MSEPGAGILIQLAGAGDDDQTYFCVAQDPQLLRLLQKPVLTLGKSHLSARCVIDPSYHSLPSPHALTF